MFQENPELGLYVFVIVLF